MVSEKIESKIASVADIFKAMGEANRLHIILLLSRQELCVCEITSILKITQSNASQHLARLKSVGLVKERRDAQWVYYSLNPETFPMILNMLKTFPKKTARHCKLPVEK
ncbi:ArsR/SmtB family transcription factor [Ferroplasma acidiphilum]|jgi:ArsR family transcriptional regulator|uniref:ArsR/SmtB family transcription factor n=1 Tax=Ferroplasma acidiphilum TaxID=74969 RepID=UPI0023F28F5E|nr:metalloregulator ArsR/SmtB family transcription factor [Ferroplasma acidiphilum]